MGPSFVLLYAMLRLFESIFQIISAGSETSFYTFQKLLPVYDNENKKEKIETYILSPPQSPFQLIKPRALACDFTTFEEVIFPGSAHTKQEQIHHCLIKKTVMRSDELRRHGTNATRLLHLLLFWAWILNRKLFISTYLS